MDVLRIDHGPIGLLGRFFLQADTDLHGMGLRLNIAPLSVLAEINSNNQADWRRLLPSFDPEFADLNDDNAYSIVIRTMSGEPVATNAVRLFDWSGSNAKSEFESLRVFYDQPRRMKRPGEMCTVTAATAKSICGRVSLSGAAWCRKDFRGHAVASIVSRLSKAYALAKWNPDYSIGLMLGTVQERGFARRFGFRTIDWDVQINGTGQGDRRFALLSMNRDEVVESASEYLVGGFGEVYRSVGHGTA
jgi:hypothetical protein